MGDLIYLKPQQLRLHPNNMRRVYPAGQVGEMADSIQAHGGVLQALLVVRDPEWPAGAAYLVVDGNLRLAAAQHLGEACPPLKCEIIEASQAEQLLIMAITSHFHYAKDPISEGLHYRRLVGEGYTVAEIGRHTGLSQGVIAGRIHLLDLDPPIREHVAAGRLPKDRRIVDALLSIDDRDARFKLADNLAQRRATIETVVKACERLAEQLARRRELQAGQAPALALTGAAAHAGRGDAAWPAVRRAAASACQACTIHEEALSHVAEPAWELITHAAQDTCRACNLRDLQSLCGQCPAVDLLRRLQDLAEHAPVPVILPVARPVEAVRGRNGRH